MNSYVTLPFNVGRPFCLMDVSHTDLYITGLETQIWLAVVGWSRRKEDITSLLWHNRPLSRRLDRCDRVIQNESRDPFGGNVYYVTMQITFLRRKFRNGQRKLHCDVVHITTKGVSSLTVDCNGVFAIKAYGLRFIGHAHVIFVVVAELWPWRRHACIFIILTLLQSWPHPWYIEQPRLM